MALPHLSTNPPSIIPKMVSTYHHLDILDAHLVCKL
jgi:hypothetical protein